MEHEITFVKWKWLITKSIDDLVVWWWFECSVQLYEILHKQIWKIMKLSMEYQWQKVEVDCTLCTDTKTYLQFVDDHWFFRLDIIIKDLLLSWYLLKSKLTLIVN